MNMKIIGEFITARRKELGMTQQQLGDAMGVSDKAVSKWERGLCCPDISLLTELTSVLKCQVTELIAGKKNEPEKSSNVALNLRGNLKFDMEHCADTVNAVLDPSGAETISPLLFGDNLEHTRDCVNGGISAQLLKNRKFTGKPTRVGTAEHWYPIGNKTFCCLYETQFPPYTRHAENYHMNRRYECNAHAVTNFDTDGFGGIAQAGIPIRSGETYDVRIVALTVIPFTLKVALVCGNQSVEKEIKIEGEDYKTYCTDLIPTFSGEAELRLIIAGRNSVCFGAVSLMNRDNFHGMRRDVIEQMKKIGMTTLRWPGGNFSGEYNWMDGLLPCDMRAPFESALGLETQPHTNGYDYHEINTDDFIALCREIGAEPFITINPAWNTPEESAAWVEYCNGDASTKYGKIRIDRGFPEPYNVRFWSLGNEFGYGHMEGDNTPAGYCRIVEKHGNAMLAVSPNLTFCASGYPTMEWVEHSARPLKKIAKLVSIHYYDNKFPIFFDPAKEKDEYYHFIGDIYTEALGMLKDFRRMLGDDEIRISFDEWNSWYAWYRPGAVIDGIFTASFYHVFFHHAKELGMDMLCHFESVNEGAIRVMPDRAFLTPIGEIMSIMKRHAGGRVLFMNDDVIATVKDEHITVTMVNKSYDEEKKIVISGVDGKLNATLYSSDEIGPTSEFTKTALFAIRDGEKLIYTIPPHSFVFAEN